MEKQTQPQTNKSNQPPAAALNAASSEQAAPALDLESWYLVPEIEPEPTIAYLWKQQHGLHIPEENIVTELPLDRLHSRSSVYVLARKPVRHKHGGFIAPFRPLGERVDGEWKADYVPLEELVPGMQAYGPIVIADHWSKGPGRFNSKLDRSSFLAALGPIAAPWAFGWKDVTRKDELPMTLYLRSA